MAIMTPDVGRLGRVIVPTVGRRDGGVQGLADLDRPAVTGAG